MLRSAHDREQRVLVAVCPDGPEEAEAAFQEKTVEVLATSEEVEVSKEARVVGEVAVGKSVEEREAVVKDTVRRTEVEEIGPKAHKSR